MINAMPKARFLACGDTAISVEFGDQINAELSDAVVRLAAAVRAAKLAGVVETVPTFRSLLVHYDPLTTSAKKLSAAIARLIERSDKVATAARVWRIPTCYEDELAPDLAAVAERTGLAAGDVVRRHAETRYHVYMLGFLPGYPYMGDLPEELRLPRRANPRTNVPAGSVAIATSLTAVYTYESPGGWHLIGSTPVSFFDAASDPPALLRPGDTVMFEPIERGEYDRIAALAAAGEFALVPEPTA